MTLIELMLTAAIIVTIVGMALPVTSDAIDSYRTAAAARYLASRVQLARMEAVKRSRSVALKFDPAGTDYSFTAYLDGNANGIRTLDVRRGVDPPLTSAERLSDNFPGVHFGLLPGIPDADGGGAGTGDGVRIGTAKILTLGANGTATAGTLYLHGRRQQFAVRVLGVTARTRVLQYESGERKWASR